MFSRCATFSCVSCVSRTIWIMLYFDYAQEKGNTPTEMGKEKSGQTCSACRRWRARHPERQKAATYRWRQKHLKEWNVYQRKWRERNPDLVRFAARRRWLKIKKNPK